MTGFREALALAKTKWNAFRVRRAALPRFWRTAHGLIRDRAGRLAAWVQISRDRIISGRLDETADCGPYIETASKSQPVPISLSISAPAPPLIELIKAGRSRNLACWWRLGDPGHIDLLLAIANG